MTTLDEIKAIEDPAERARVAEEHARSLRPPIAQAVAERNMAMLAAIEAGEKKATVYKAVGVSRSTLVKVEQRAPATVPAIPDPLTVAVAAQERLGPLVAERDEAREVRDVAVLDLLFKRHVPNHEVSEETGLSSARVAQLRSEALG